MSRIYQRKGVWYGTADDMIARIAHLEAQIAAADRLAEALRKCIRIMNNRQPDKMPDGVYIARTALAAYENSKDQG